MQESKLHQKGRKKFKKTQTRTGFIDEFLEETVKNSSLYESDQDAGYDVWSTEHNIHASIRMNNTLLHKCMNLLFLQERYHISILDGGADTCVLGKGWEIVSTHNLRRANVVGFDHETAIKRNLPIVSAITALDLPNGQSILLVISRIKNSRLILSYVKNIILCKL